ncbi:MAG: hypothetical protein Q7K43_00180 [Candidatus Woesearchaeota archaeon]|nr:hypothetical protein [Candidatus Woesearchaeota archaeon]
MNKNAIIAIVLGVLVLIAAVQAWQLMDIKGKLSTGSASLTAPSAASPSVSGSPQLPSNLQNLPSMVGGC